VNGDDPRSETPPPSRQLRIAIQTRPARAVTDEWDWQILAACRGMDVEIFYHPARERCRQKNQRITQAKAVCQTCPVITECATWALQTREPYGVWGGLSEDERAAILGIRQPAIPQNPAHPHQARPRGDATTAHPLNPATTIARPPEPGAVCPGPAASSQPGCRPG
jgi:WhiB family redox-sensing transcriptional regulator